MFDTIEKIDHSLVQHGPMNQRVYLMKLSGQDLPDLIFKIDVLAKRESYTKIFAKVPLQVKPLFSDLGYIEEASIPDFYHGEIGAVFLAKYLDTSRRTDVSQDEIDAILAMSQEKHNSGSQAFPDDDIVIRPAGPKDADTMAQLFREVFESYPFPIHDPDYLRETMETHIQYFCAIRGDTMVAVSSSEMDQLSQNVEMTDFATLRTDRGKGLAQRLLKVMEEHMREMGMRTYYTIARALSAGMNITFARCGYRYGGTLTNNTNICGNIESMNVWYKNVDKTESLNL